MKRNALVLASLLAGLLAAGCGKHGDDQSSGVVASSQAAGLDQTTAAPRTPEPGEVEGGPKSESQGAVSPDSLPPDISASSPDSLAYPGKPVEIFARGTPDVVAVTLWDGIGQKQPMTYDPEVKVWRAFYRVPLGTSRERVGLSLTAKNSAGKWRRVWVTLILHRETPESQPEPAPGS